MAGIKRKAEGPNDRAGKKIKQKPLPQAVPSKTLKAKVGFKNLNLSEEDELSDSDVSEDFGGFSEDNDEGGSSMGEGDDEALGNTTLQKKSSVAKTQKELATTNGNHDPAKPPGTTSRESHAKQKTLSQERKASKPNADSIARSKKIWERLRIKSSVQPEERKKLISELFEIISGRVKDFVFKHDAVRAIQTAVRYASLEQRKLIARELKGDYCSLAESKYAKFLIGKLLVHGDSEIRDMIIPEFYGHVKRLIRHPEASWILDDVYRTVASPQQKVILLREFYGPEFALFKTEASSNPTSTLSVILSATPEKRQPIMRFLHELINQLIQKKTTGFTLLHDAMHQYYLNTKPSSPEADDFLELLKGDDEGDLLKNLAFTKSGAHLVCLALAHGNAKDRKLILRTYKDTIRLLSEDANGHLVILTAYDTIDDTVMTSKAVFPELLGKDSQEQQQDLLSRLNSPTARVPLLYLLTPTPPKHLNLSSETTTLLSTIHSIRTTTSKKEPQTRRHELLKSLSPTLLSLIASNPHDLISTTFGCQAITDILLADGISVQDKTPALTAIADLTTSASAQEDLANPSVGRLLKSLVQGGRYNAKTKTVETLDPPLRFHDMLYERVRGEIVSWATGPNSFVVVAMVEAGGFASKEEVLKTLRKSKEVGAAKDGGNKGAGLLVEMVK